MPRLWLGLIAGVIYGSLAAASMLPMQFPDKRSALTGAFLSRFAIGLLIGAVIGSPQVERLGAPAWLIGLAIGLLVSAPDAVITKAYAPILGMGAVGGAIIGWIVQRWGV
jgi:uncharacterized membrane protein